MRIGHLSIPIVLALILSAVPGWAETLTYEHEGDPLFTITYPPDWYVDADFDLGEDASEDGEPALRIVEAMPDDDTRLWFGAWAAPGSVTTLDEALDYLNSLDSQIFTEGKASEPQETDFNGMPARTFFGTARRNGDAVEYAAGLFEPRDGVIAAVLYVGRPKTWLKHQQDLRQIVESIAAPAD